MRKTLGADQDFFSVSDSSKKCSGDGKNGYISIVTGKKRGRTETMKMLQLRHHSGICIL